MTSDGLRIVRRYITHPIAALVSFWAIACLFHGAGLDLTRELLGGGDGFIQGLPSKVFGASFSAWNPYAQLGHYAFANTQFQALYPPGLIIMTLFPNTLGYNLFILCHYALAGFFFYLFARNLALSGFAAYFGGVCFMSCGFLLAHKGHQAMMSTAVWLPLTLLFADRYARSGELKNATFGGVALALSILGGFPQVTLYGTILAFAYLGYRCFADRDRTFASRLRLYLAGVAVLSALGVLLSSTQLLAVADTLPYITREKITHQMFNQDFFPVAHVALLFIPNLLGGFYGSQSYSSAFNLVEVYPYVGLLPLILALFAIAKLLRRSTDVLFWTAAVSICAALAFGLTPVQRILYHVPFYNLFRAPGRHLFEVNFGLCILAAYGVNALPGRGPSVRKHALVTIAVAASGFTFVLAMSQLLRHLITQQSFSGVQIEQYLANPVLTLAELKPLIYENLAPGNPTVLYAILLFAASVLVFWRLTAGQITGPLKVAALVVVLLDVWLPYRTLYDNPDTSALMDSKSRPELDFILKRGFDRAHYRIYPTDPQTEHEYPLLNMMYGIGAINDYSPMWSKRYQSVTQFISNGESPTLWFEPKLLQTIGAQYLLTRHHGVAQQLRRVPDLSENGDVMAKRSLSLDCGVAQCSSVASAGPESISLVSPDGRNVGIIQIPMAFLPSTVYQVAFDARTEAERSAVLNVDLYSVDKWPLDAGQMHSLAVLGSTFARRVLLIRSRAAPGRGPCLRLFTGSKFPVEIRNLTLAVAPSLTKAYRELYGSPEGYLIFENPGALPRFRFVSELLPASNLTEARAAMLAPGFDPRRQAVVEGLSSPKVVEPGRILSERIGNDDMNWQIETGKRSFFMVADSWAPGWLARVDGRETPIQIVDGFLRGVSIEGPGRHSIEMHFRPRSLRNGLLGTILGCIVGAGTFVIGRKVTFRRPIT